MNKRPYGKDHLMEHLCEQGKQSYGEIIRQETGAWHLWLDAETADITYCPFCGIEIVKDITEDD